MTLDENMYEVKSCGCWEWLGEQLDGVGYAKSGGYLVYRQVYKNTFGEAPKGYHIDHLCANVRCVNPTHMEAVPSWVNQRRRRLINRLFGWASTCAKGHVMDDMNTIWRANGTGRQCRKCQDIKRQEFAVRSRGRKKPVDYNPTWDKPHGSIKRKHEYEEVTQELLDLCETTWGHVELLKSCSHPTGSSKAITYGKPKTSSLTKALETK